MKNPTKAEFDALARRMWGVKDVNNLTFEELHAVGEEWAALQREKPKRA